MFKQEPHSIILDLASRKNQIIYGQQSINQQLPVYLRKKTKDYDIFSKNPKGAAEELAEKLNKNGNGYKVKKAIYGRTWKVKNKEGETIADYTQPARYPKTINILGVKYAELSYSKRKIGKILRNKEASYRWEKDKDTLKRIRKGEIMPW